MSLSEQEERLLRLIAPTTLAARDRMQHDNLRFAHYTSAEVAISILEKKEVWMRNAHLTNDFSEIQHGRACFDYAYDSEAGKRLQGLLESWHPGMVAQLEELIEGWGRDLEFHTFVTCVSEHLPSEDKYGRLSMWRAYGRKNGVALVLNNSAFKGESQTVNIYSDEVAYLDRDDYLNRFSQIVDNMQSHADELGKLDNILGWVFTMVRSALLFTKHPAFHEEKEWRIVYSPNYEASDVVVASPRSVGGVPQMIYKIPLEHDDRGAGAWSIAGMLDRVIIGPTEFPYAIYQELVRVLDAAGVPEPKSKIVNSGIPLRD